MKLIFVAKPLKNLPKNAHTVILVIAVKEQTIITDKELVK
jgi:hypothetical protein